MKLIETLFFCFLLQCDSDSDSDTQSSSCPHICSCTDSEGNQTANSWLVCNDFPQQIASSFTHLTIHSKKVKTLTAERLKPFTNLEYLALNGLEMEEIDDDTFEQFDQLRNLKVTSNKLTRIDDATLRNCSNLVDLSLKSNFIRTISTNAFRHLERLQRLDLSRNLVTQLPDLLPASLVELDASDNSIVRLPHVRVLLSRLHRLDLCANHFARYEADNFVAPRLAYLCLGDRVHVVNASAFDWGQEGSASAMRSLEISSETLSVDSLIDSLRRMTALQSLSLSHVTIPSEIRADFRLKELRTLNLKNVSCHVNGSDDLFVFQLAAHVQTLCLDGSPQIARILLSADENLRKFETIINLQLNNVDLSGITSRQFDFLKNLRTLSLLGNPLMCDCALDWLVQRVHNNSLLVANPEQILCAFPADLRGLHLFSEDVTGKLCRDDVNHEDRDVLRAPVTIYHVVYVLIAMTGLLIVAFLIVIILLCKTRWRRAPRETRVVYRSGYSLDLLPAEDQISEFSARVAASNDEIKDPRPYSTLTFHPRREQN
uniref:LRRCT domain-containing protein n=1 Tax=Strigamia maritima TaxID=126957 RepID=T1JBN9_STRMM